MLLNFHLICSCLTAVRREVVVFSFAIVLLCCGCREKTPDRTVFDNSRIITMAPSLTETVFELGLGDNVVGVSKFCSYPDCVKKLPKVGGLVDPDLEAIVRLAPTCVVLQKNSTDLGRQLKTMGIPVLHVDANTLPEILDSFAVIGNALGRHEKGLELRQNTEHAISELAGISSAKTALLVIWHEIGSTWTVQVAAEDGYYSDLFATAGVELLPKGRPEAFPILNAEAVAALDPDYIIELVHPDENINAVEVMADWKKTVPSIKACKNDCIFVINDSSAVIPGPRISKFVEIIKGILLK